MSTSNSIRHAVRYALLTSAAAGAAVPAYAADQTIQEVVVTGSRIAQPNLETTSPVTQVTAEDVITQGVTKVEDLINQLPQAFAAQNATVSNGSTGTATVNLRGLGSNRTLVLIDGRRMPYGGVTNSAADLNQIPTAMVERVEVLTGGASAVYGSDAVAGVVNFIMKKDFEGIQFDGQYSLYQHNNDFGGPGAVKLRDVISARAATNPAQFALPDDNVTDGNGVQGTLIMGVSTEDGRGNITAYASYQDNHEVLQRDRDFSACSLDVNPTVSFACGGSSTAFPGRFTDFGSNSNASNGPDGKPGGGDDVPDELPALRNGGMQLRCQSTARPTESLSGLPACPAQRTHRVRMRFDDRAVDQNQLRLGPAEAVPQRFPTSGQRPASKSPVTPTPISKRLWQVSPGSAGPQNPENCLEKTLIVATLGTATRRSSHRCRDAHPLLIRDRRMSSHALLEPELRDCPCQSMDRSENVLPLGLDGNCQHALDLSASRRRIGLRGE